ncbi:WXG100 family type VII secretion target [Clostridium gasigenes]|uniref:ESAT-6-like protein n=1 Tax=Clostridium gasigenes TaxID=94869 RepID=A0A7X0SJL0_9CLOT|nr:WXG100 family type VII secretion target [Clostridium gasigenes]MBB6716651.1 WXG100 family type VII secretion target [Clostridium gasigenes]
MASKITITPEKLEASARKFKRDSDNTKSMLSSLDKEVREMSTLWAGTASKAFADQYNDLKPSMNKFVELLSDINKQLTSVQKTMVDVDRQIASKLRR